MTRRIALISDHVSLPTGPGSVDSGGQNVYAARALDGVPSNVDPSEMRLAAGPALTALQPLSQRSRQLFRPVGADIHDFCYGLCAPAACGCRKPGSGLLLRAAAEHGLALEDSWLIGDILDGIEAGHRAACRSVLIDTGNEAEWRASPMREPDHAATTLAEAAASVLSAAPARRRSLPRACAS